MITAMLFLIYAMAFLGLCILGGIVAWLIPHTLEAIGDFIAEGRL